MRGPKDDAPQASRKKLYHALATFKDGFGFEKVVVNLDIDPTNGSCDVKQHIFVRSYAARGKVIREDDTWSAPILNPKLVVNPARDVAIIGPTFDEKRTNVKWDFALANALGIGEDFDFLTTYQVGPHGVTSGEGAVDEFFYGASKYPVKELSVSVRLKDTSTFMLTAGSILPEISDDPDINAREALRFIDGITGKDGGYDYNIEYPLRWSYKFAWKIARQLSQSALAADSTTVAPMTSRR